MVPILIILLMVPYVLSHGAPASFYFWLFFFCRFLGGDFLGIARVQGGGRGLASGKFSPWDISKWVYFACSPEFAVGNFAPTCCEPTFGWWWLLLFADSLPLRLTGLLSLPDEFLMHCCYLMATFFCFNSCGRAKQTFAT